MKKLRRGVLSILAKNKRQHTTQTVRILNYLLPHFPHFKWLVSSEHFQTPGESIIAHSSFDNFTLVIWLYYFFNQLGLATELMYCMQMAKNFLTEQCNQNVVGKNIRKYIIQKTNFLYPKLSPFQIRACIFNIKGF